MKWNDPILNGFIGSWKTYMDYLNGVKTYLQWITQYPMTWAQKAGPNWQEALLQSTQVQPATLTDSTTIAGAGAGQTRRREKLVRFVFQCLSSSTLNPFISFKLSPLALFSASSPYFSSGCAPKVGNLSQASYTRKKDENFQLENFVWIFQLYWRALDGQYNQ